MNPAEILARIVLFAAAGALAGILHFAILRRNVELIAAGGSPLAALLTALARAGITAAIFTSAAVFYGVAVLWMLAGFVAARFIAVRTPGVQA